MAEQMERKPKRARSPNYPSTPLGEAIERARVLYRAEQHHLAPVDAILAHWGYSPKSGPGWSVLASLKKFGLLEDEGSGANRTARLSENALTLVLDEREDSSERVATIRQAAMTPALHKELLSEYGGTLPSDANLKFRLQREHGFTDSGAADFIRQFRSTVAFAKLDEGGKIAAEDEDKDALGSESLMTPPIALEEPAAKQQGTRVVQLPIAPKEWAALQAPFPLTEDKWTQMMDVLNAMKPALTVAEIGTDEAEQGEEPNGEPSD